MKKLYITTTPSTTGDYLFPGTPERTSGVLWPTGSKTGWAGTLYGSADGLTWFQAMSGTVQMARANSISLMPHMKFTATAAGAESLTLSITEESNKQ